MNQAEPVLTTASPGQGPDPLERPTLVGRVRALWSLLREAGEAWLDDNAMRLSAAVAMYTVLSLSPILVITIKVVSVAFGEEAAATQVQRQTQQLLGPVGAQAVASMIVSTSKPGAGQLATLLSVGLLIFTASGVFAELRDSLNDLWGVVPVGGRGVVSSIRDRLRSMGMVFVIGFLLLVSQVVTTLLLVASEYVMGDLGWVSVVTDLAVSIIVIAVLFALLFRVLPDAILRWREAFVGGAVTAVLFKVGQYLQALYFTYSSTESAYGAAGSFVVLLLWVYYSCWILFFGAELIRVYVRRQGRRIAPAPGALHVPSSRGNWKGGKPQAAAVVEQAIEAGKEAVEQREERTQA